MVRKIDPNESWAPHLVRVRVRICKACNNRMNDALEMPARELVIAMWDGVDLALGYEDARAIAAWVTKVEALYSLMRHWRDDVSPRVHPEGSDGWNAARNEATRRSDLFRLLDKGRLPPATTICALYMAGEGRTKPLGIRSDPQHGGYSATNLMPLLFETIFRDYQPGRHRSARQLDSRWTRLWPIRRDEVVHWPPRERTSVLDVIDYQAERLRQSHFMTMGSDRTVASDWVRVALSYDEQGVRGILDWV
jgi:hypothetical protein